MTLMTAEASSALLDAGITVRPVGPAQVSIHRSHDAGTPLIAVVRRRSAPLSPSHVRHLAHGAPGRGEVLLVVPAASDAALDAARAAGISVLVVGDGRGMRTGGHVVLSTEIVHLGDAEIAATSSLPPLRPGPPPWGTLTVVRHLLTGAVAGQRELADRAAVSQGRVSQVLSPLVEAGLVRRVTTGGQTIWVAAGWDALADWWLAAYPGPGGLSTHWYGLASVREQAQVAGNALVAGGLPVAVSGDIAADVLAPWRRPARAVLYADVRDHPDAADLTRSGLVPSGAEEATLELLVPADPGLWAPPVGETSGQVPLADGMQVLWDVRRAPGSDVDQAVAALRQVLRARAAKTEQR